MPNLTLGRAIRLTISIVLHLVSTGGIAVLSVRFIDQKYQKSMLFPVIVICYFSDGVILAVVHCAKQHRKFVPESHFFMGWVKDVCDYVLTILCVIVGAIISPTKDNIQSTVLLVVAVGGWALTLIVLIRPRAFHGFLDLFTTALQSLLLFYATAKHTATQCGHCNTGLIIVVVLLFFVISWRNYREEKAAGNQASGTLMGLVLDIALPELLRRLGYPDLAQHGLLYACPVLQYNLLGFSHNQGHQGGAGNAGIAMYAVV